MHQQRFLRSVLSEPGGGGRGGSQRRGKEGKKLSVEVQRGWARWKTAHPGLRKAPQHPGETAAGEEGSSLLKVTSVSVSRCFLTLLVRDGPVMRSHAEQWTFPVYVPHPRAGRRLFLGRTYFPPKYALRSAARPPVDGISCFLKGISAWWFYFFLAERKKKV